MVERRPEQYLTPALLLLACLADGLPRHAYRLGDELTDMTGWKPATSTVADTIARLERDGLVEEHPVQGRQKPYRITEAGRAELDVMLALANRVVRDGRAALKQWRQATGRTGDVPPGRTRVDADLPAPLLERLDQAADRGGRSKRAIVEQALERALRPPTAKVICPVCQQPAYVTAKNRVRAHNDPRTGQPCTGRGADAAGLPHLQTT
jgi:DNA-binding PadR family transcriptional regulator